MAYTWDKRKAASNLTRHGVDFADAVTVLEDELALSMPDPTSSSEDWFVAIGMDSLGRILVVAPKERRHYEGQP